MAINFENVSNGGGTPGTPAQLPDGITDIGNGDGGGTPITPTPKSTGKSLNLKKSMTLDLTKRNPGLEKVLVGAGWDVATEGADYDLDVAAFLLRGGKLISEEHVIFFNHKKLDGICLDKDNRTGVGEGDDEKITLELSKIDPAVTEIAFCVVIFDAAQKGQTFGHVKNARVRLVNLENNQELCNFPLNTDFSTDTAIIFTKLRRNDAGWEYEAVGEGKQADLNGLAAYFS